MDFLSNLRASTSVNFLEDSHIATSLVLLDKDFLGLLQHLAATFTITQVNNEAEKGKPFSLVNLFESQSSNHILAKGRGENMK